ncbi:hypothetical protein ACNTMW_05005 [Planosporangium sp. 12N6]|uniref:hypothetical protein n=1 Tax=Planosporangium spinosum TaxID=3402278 RepID=UPI003CFA16C0
MHTWQDWVGAAVYVDDRVRATVVEVDADGVTLDSSTGDWLPLRPFDVISLIRTRPMSRWWAAVREVTDRSLRLGPPVHDDVERRRFPRRALSAPVSVWWPGAGADSNGLTTDVSIGGFSAVFDHLPPEGSAIAARLDGLPRPIVAVATCLSANGDQARFAFHDIGALDVEILTAITLSRPVRKRVVASGEAVLWSTLGSQPVTIRSTPLGGVVTGAARCPSRKEHVILESQGVLHRAEVISVGGGVPRLGWLD